VESILIRGVDGGESWLDRGCIVFSQYLDSARWLAVRLSALLTTETVGLYGGGDASGVFIAGVFERRTRDELREQVKLGALRLIIGTDAASEGLNLQRLGSLINLDLPWNPTRLEQRKGRIQRIGQLRDEVLIYNMRYRDSVEDRVHSLLSERLRSIRDMFGQLPDTLEDVWVNVALADVERAKQVIDAVPLAHPFEMRYDRVEPVDFESCSRVLDQHAQLELLRKGW
jgi:superfamily II DNA/RNA helicase